MRNALRTAIAITLLVLSVGTLTGCELLKRELKPEEALAQTRKATESIKSAEFDIEVDMEIGGEPISMSGSGVMELPMAVEMVGTMTINGESIPYEQRVIDGKQYMKMSLLGDTWWVIEGAQNDVAALGSSDPNEYFAYFEVVESTEDLGTESIQGTECRHLVLELDETRLAELLGSAAPAETREAMAASTMQVEVWIAEETGLPMREIVDTTMEVPGVADSSTHVVAQIDFTAFDTPVEIVAPEGAKPMPIPTQ